MSNTSINIQVVKATKWAGITEIVSKLVTPITSMLLARLLTPEAFGVVATLNMIITFAELFTDAGFQKYLIQHEFHNAVDREESTTVAFWSNLVMSLGIWSVIALFAEPLSALVGNPGLGIVLIIACVSIPLAAFSSIQMALYKRDLDFKTLFKVRLVGISIPLIVTIPLAFWLRSYWALVFGTIAHNLANAVFLTWFSSWKPRFYYSFVKLKEMLSFTIWTLIESVSIWLTNYVDIFIVGTMLSQYYLGLYKTSSVLVSQILGIVAAATTPVLFSALSRYQNDDNDFQRTFYKFQKYVGILVIPMGVGIFLYKDLVTSIILGSQWGEAAGFVGLWGLIYGFKIVISNYASEAYRAKGKPKISTLSQWIYILALWPTLIIVAKYGFVVLYTARSILLVWQMAVHFVILYLILHFSLRKMVKNILPVSFCSMVMLGISLMTKPIFDSVLWQVVSIIICAITYFGTLLLFREERKIIISVINNYLIKYFHYRN